MSRDPIGGQSCRAPPRGAANALRRAYIRLAVDERAALSPDALTGMEANHRFVGPETVESKVFGRLAAWQNWIFTRPNASGPDGALTNYGTGQRANFDRRRV